MSLGGAPSIDTPKPQPPPPPPAATPLAPTVGDERSRLSMKNAARGGTGSLRTDLGLSPAAALRSTGLQI